MPYLRVYIHFVWSTKNRYPYLESVELRNAVWDHIAENAKKKEIFIDIISGYSDHCHCLLSLGSNQNIAQIIQLIKGESSYWVNKNLLSHGKFQWQQEYYGSAVSERNLQEVRNYIRNQERHHKTLTFQEEYEEFVRLFGA